MKLFKFALRIWITVASVVAFTASWMVLSHSPKPEQWPITAPMLEPLPPIPTSAQPSDSLFALQPIPSHRRSMFVTGGS